MTDDEPGTGERTPVRRVMVPAVLDAAVAEGLIRSAAWWHGVRTLFASSTRSHARDVAAAELRRTRAEREELVDAALREHRSRLRTRRRHTLDDGATP